MTEWLVEKKKQRVNVWLVQKRAFADDLYYQMGYLEAERVLVKLLFMVLGVPDV